MRCTVQPHNLTNQSIMKQALTLALALVAGTLGAQNNGGYRYAQDIVISDNGLEIANGQAGGLNAPQFSSIDLNNDGTLDLLVYDRGAKVALTFINNGTANLVDYHFAPEYMPRFPQGNDNFMLARDYNCDGIEDLFFFDRAFGSTGGIFVWKGGYDANDMIQFTPVVEEMRYNSVFGYQPIYIFNPDLPNISDMDGDGDMDIAAFTLDFTFVRHVYYYENQSDEQGHGCDSLIMELRHQCWGLFAESGTNNTVVLSPGVDSCATNDYWDFRDERDFRHTGSTLTSLDYNGDGALDMIMGDVSFNTLNLMTGSLINDTVLIVQQDATYPSYDEPTDLFSMPAAYVLDVNNDGKLDLISAVNEIGYQFAVTDSVAWYYQNTGSNSNMQFDLQQKNFLENEMLDFGHKAAPAFFDHNGDGLLDLLVGNVRYLQPGGMGSVLGLALLENTGTATAPAFNLVTRDYMGWSNYTLYDTHPTFGDLDGDGDLDLILGDSNGDLTFIENTAGAGNPVAWATPVANYQSINVGQNSTPQLFDLNGDGDLDLIVGEDNGNINYFENRGTSNMPGFDTTPTSETIGWIDVNSMGSGSSAPHFIRRDTTIELLLGHQKGQVIYMNNINNNILGTYDTLSMNYLYTGTYSKIATADLDGDDTLEIVVGNNRGGLTIFSWQEEIVDTTVQVIAPIQTAGTILAFPNPARDVIYLQNNQASDTEAQVVVYNLLGQAIRQSQWAAQEPRHALETQGWTNGVYIIEVRTATDRQVLKVRVE